MFENIGKYISGFKKTTGIFIKILSDEKLYFHAISLTIDKNNINITNNITTENEKEILDFLDPKSPLFINIEGKGVLHKENKLGTNKKNINRIFPNININDFSFQFFQPESGKGFVSLIRKTALNKIKDKFETKGHFIIDISLGPFTAFFLREMLDSGEDGFMAGSHKVVLENGLIKSIIVNSDDQENYYINDIKLSSVVLPVFSQVASYIAEEKVVLNDDLDCNDNEFKYFKYFKKSGIALLVIVFSLLLVNYMFFEKYKNKRDELSLTAIQNKNDVEKIESLNRDIELAENIVENSGIARVTFFSFYADRIASFLPSKIVLTEMWVQPIMDKLKEEKEIRYVRSGILVKGTTGSDLQFNSWQRSLEKEEWVNDITIINYFRDNQNSPAEFEIEILIK